MKTLAITLVGLVTSFALAPSAFATQDAGYVYTLSNSTESNSIISFKRGEDGALSRVASYKTGGKGIAGDIDDQHSIRVSGDWVIAANPGSDDISVFKQKSGSLEKIGQFPSGGNNPVSLAISGSKLVVANQAVNAGTPNLAMFQIGDDGKLTMMMGAKMMFKTGAGPADIDFSPNGKMLAVSYGYQMETTSMVAIYGVGMQGKTTMMSDAPAFGPVGLSWNPNGKQIYVSTFRGASVLTFDVSSDGKLARSQKLMDGEAAACWTSVNAAGNRLYVANFVSNSISVYSLDEMGQAKFMSAVKRPDVSGNDTKDIALSSDGKFLYVLGTTSKRIDTFKVDENGGLQFVGSTKPIMGTENWKGLAAS